MNLSFLFNILITSMLCLPIWGLIRYLYLKKYFLNKKKRIRIFYEVILSAFVLYIIAVLAMTVLPIGVTKGGKGYVNLRPIVTEIDIFKSAVESKIDMSMIYENLYGNIILFLPLGFFLPLLFKSKKIILFKISFIAFLFSSCIELLQWYELRWKFGRIADIDDVILNTLGAIFGYFLFSVLYKVMFFKKLYSQFVGSI